MTVLELLIAYRQTHGACWVSPTKDVRCVACWAQDGFTEPPLARAPDVGELLAARRQVLERRALALYRATHATMRPGIGADVRTLCQVAWRQDDRCELCRAVDRLADDDEVLLVELWQVLRDEGGAAVSRRGRRRSA